MTNAAGRAGGVAAIEMSRFGGKSAGKRCPPSSGGIVAIERREGYRERPLSALRCCDEPPELD